MARYTCYKGCDLAVWRRCDFHACEHLICPEHSVSRGGNLDPMCVDCAAKLRIQQFTEMAAQIGLAGHAGLLSMFIICGVVVVVGVVALVAAVWQLGILGPIIGGGLALSLHHGAKQRALLRVAEVEVQLPGFANFYEVWEKAARERDGRATTDFTDDAWRGMTNSAADAARWMATEKTR